MNVNQILGTGTSNASAEATSRNQLGQKDFLKLLVAQMKNQDPSNPADNAEFLSQIAQFSMVSGIDGLGTSFKSVAGSLYTGQAMQAASLVGRDVLTEASSAMLQPGQAIEGFIQFDDPSSGITMKIRDQSGVLVNTIDLGVSEPGSRAFSWNGLDDAGNQVPGGEYSITVNAIVDGKQVAVPVRLYNKVESVSVDRSTNNIMLHLAGNQSVGFSEISVYK